MEESVKNFYLKNASENYVRNYDNDHGKRLDFVVNEFGLDKVQNLTVADMGCGCGNYFARMDKNNKFIGFDGAVIPDDKKLCSFESLDVDLNTKYSQDYFNKYNNKADMAICSETLEHLTDPYTCLDQLKKIVKFNGIVIITIPTLDMWHNFIYPGLMSSKESFEQFLGQMAFEIVDYKEFTAGWQSHCWKLINKPYSNKKMLFEKTESKFLNASPLEMVNL